jgi:hypothetical protein
MGTQSLEFKSGLDDSKFQAGLKRMETGAQKSTGKISGMMKGIGIMATATAVLGAAKGIANMTGDLSDQANQLNMNVESMQKLQGVMAQGGVDADKFVMGMQKIGMAMTTAREEGGPTLENFEKMGISFTQIADAGDDTEKVFRLMADALEKSNGSLDVQNAALEIVGAKQGKMVGVMKAGTQAIDEQAKSVAILSARQVEYGDRVADVAEQKAKNLKIMAAEKALMGSQAIGVGGGMKDKVDAPTFAKFSGPDPRALAAEKKALEIRKEALQVTIKTAEENHKSSMEAKDAAREALMAALSGQRAARPSSKERRVNRMMAELENPTDRKTGLTSGTLSRRLSPGEKVTTLTTGDLSSQSRSLMARGGAAKALSEFNKTREMEKANAEFLQRELETLKSIERGINGE